MFKQLQESHFLQQHQSHLNDKYQPSTNTQKKFKKKKKQHIITAYVDLNAQGQTYTLLHKSITYQHLFLNNLLFKSFS